VFVLATLDFTGLPEESAVAKSRVTKRVPIFRLRKSGAIAISRMRYSSSDSAIHQSPAGTPWKTTIWGTEAGKRAK
jgi:hypothetical protein